MNIAALTRFVDSAKAPAPGAACELCAAPLRPAHDHVNDREEHTLRCACRACALLFAGPADGRYRTVPDRVLSDPATTLAAAWDSVDVPVGLAFVVREAGDWAVYYPSPAGPTRSGLPTHGLGQLVRGSRLAAALEPDVEALLVDGRRGASHGETCLLVPISACYELVAIIRRRWRGMDGGDAVRAEITAFLGRLRQQSRPLPEEAP